MEISRSELYSNTNMRYGSKYRRDRPTSDAVAEKAQTTHSTSNKVDRSQMEQQTEEEKLHQNLKRRKIELKNRHKVCITGPLTDISFTNREKNNKELSLYKESWISKAQEYDSILSKAKIELYEAMMKLTDNAIEIHSKINQKRSVGKRGLSGNLKKKVEEIKQYQ